MVYTVIKYFMCTFKNKKKTKTKDGHAVLPAVKHASSHGLLTRAPKVLEKSMASKAT